MRNRVRLAAEDGAALAMALIVMLVIALLIGVAVSQAIQTNRSTRRDASNKRALEAAEAGLQVALYRLNMLRPDDQHCVGESVQAPAATGTCASGVDSLGNGTTYQYYTTPVLTGGTCVGATLQSGTEISNRCITATGTADGIRARSQIRIGAFAAEPLFPVPGIIGLDGITDYPNAKIGGSEGTNGTITGLNNSVITGNVDLGPAAGYVRGVQGPNPPAFRLNFPFVLDPVDPGSSAQSSLAACPARQAAGYPSCNDDYRITNWLANPSHPTVPYDQASGHPTTVTFDAATRTLTLSNNASLTLGGSLYNFCNLLLGNNATIALAPGTRTEIIIDSPDDPGSGCPPGSGILNSSNNTWTNLSQDPTALQIFVYGWNNGQNVVTFTNNAAFNGLLYAPQSTINLINNAGFNGAIAGATVNVLNNATFNWDNRAGSLMARTTGIYYRTAWAQCVPESTASNPGGGCG
jgi:Tfp pilus assembly protein PilX